MQKNKFRKGLVFGVSMLFIITPLFTTSLPSISNRPLKNINFNNLNNLEFVPGEFIVKFTTDAIPSHIEFFNENYQVSSMNKIFNNHENTIIDNIYLLKVPKDSDILSITDDYISQPFVEYAEPNFLLHLFAYPNDLNFSNQWYLHNIGQTGGTIDADIDAPDAWDIETGSSDIVIAIIDSGVDYTHSDLAGNIWINEDEIPDNQIDDDNNGFIDDNIGWDFVGGRVLFRIPDNDPLDGFGHGTHCAGLASAVTNNSDGMAGICWNCKIMCIKVGNDFGFINSFAMYEGIVYAVDNGANVISMSFGTSQSAFFLKYVINYAYDHGVTAVAAAGNVPYSRRLYPAAYDSVISVAATDENDERAEFSSYGDWIDVCAPGTDIYSTLPSYYVVINNLGYNLNYDCFNGTSMSCPIVAGLVGLILSFDPALTPDEVKNIIHDSTDWIETDRYIGNGRINAHKALLIMSGATVPPNKPSPPSGPINGKIETVYTYETTSTDPDGDDLYYLFDWDDGSYSGWVGPFASGAAGSASHKWSKRGNYKIIVKARDSYGVESDWSDPLRVTMPRNKAIISPLLNFLQNHPNMFPILRQFLGL